MILLDTNLLARITNSADPDCSLARGAIHKFFNPQEKLIVVPRKKQHAITPLNTANQW